MKKLILLRHAIAQDRRAAMTRGVEDAQRPLTSRGREKMRCATQGLQALQPHLDLLLTSPLRRALQTAQIVMHAYPQPVVVKKSAALLPGAKLQALLDVLDEYPDLTSVMCVGHEPGLSRLASELIMGRHENLLNLKKGGACLLEFPRKFRAGDARLGWLLTPRMLRQLK